VKWEPGEATLAWATSSASDQVQWLVASQFEERLRPRVGVLRGQRWGCSEGHAMAHAT
jgi:hypothetical protein